MPAHSRALAAALAAGLIARPWAVAAEAAAAAPCAAAGLSDESCRAAPAGPSGREHLLLQVQRGAAAAGRGVGNDHTNCSFAVPPETPFYWEPECSLGMTGCWADGVHAECRFCNYHDIPCPTSAWLPSQDTCDFDNEPLPADVGYYYEEKCPQVGNGLGCLADGKHQGCRFCGGGAYATVPCKVNQCTFANEPATPYYYDRKCEMGMLGCKADGIHEGCRFCGRRPFESVECPPSAKIPEEACWFRNEPNISYFWDSNCSMGTLGCWADGIHAECRFCGGGAGSPYAEVPCP